jgi:hypothetical protein
MRIDISKFGKLLISRPSGHEAFLAFCAGYKLSDSQEPIELDFTHVHVLAPSWADEFISNIKNKFPNPVVCLPSSNASVIESLKFV